MRSFQAVIKPREKMTVAELLGRAHWFDELAGTYQRVYMPETARKFTALAQEYRDEAERRPDTAE